MKLLVASDIHGSLKYLNILLEQEKKYAVDKIVLLGDLYYHGPRNSLPEEYAPMKVCEVLNSIKDRIIVLKGNCDAEVDEMISSFPFNLYYYTLNSKGDKLSFTHGHHIDSEMKKNSGKVLLYGHSHIFDIKNEDGLLLANPGSISLPRNSSSRNFFIVDDNSIEVHDLVTDNITSKINY